MTVEVQLDEAKKRLRDLIEAAIRGEDILIVTESHTAVRLAPVESPKRRPRFGSAKGLVMMADDFDAPVEEPVENVDTEKASGNGARFWASFGAWQDERPVEATLRDIHEARRSRAEPPVL
jgi:antitoxin (DNA-binding transcriptional repressor) of toxin-antitoxin stability system